MTRKQMIIHLKSVLDNLSTITSNRVKAEAILDDIERLGMLPPKTAKYKNYTSGLNNITELMSINEWEEAK